MSKVFKVPNEIIEKFKAINVKKDEIIKEEKQIELKMDELEIEAKKVWLEVNKKHNPNYEYLYYDHEKEKIFVKENKEESSLSRMLKNIGA